MWMRHKHVVLVSRNLRSAFRPRDYHKSEGIYLVDPLADKANLKKSKPVKLLSVDSLRKALRFVKTNLLFSLLEFFLCKY